jgi:hypothetical protein
MKAAFIMMKFGSSSVYDQIVNAIRSALSPFGINGLRADEREYNQDLFSNILTYMYGCWYGIAVFERIDRAEFNPNVSLEVGYMFALKKPVCLLRDKTLRTLHTDLAGKIYRTFDAHDPMGSIPRALAPWLKDMGAERRDSPTVSDKIAHPLLYSGSDAGNWSRKEIETFFQNLEKDAIERARREYEYIDTAEGDVKFEIIARAREIVQRLVRAYRLEADFEDWERQSRVS